MWDQVYLYGGIYIISCIGAGLNLFVLLLANGHLNFLKNNIFKNEKIMGSLFIFLGGFVGALFHIGAGFGLGVNELPNIVLLGFGWQSLFSGGTIVLNNRKLREERDGYKAKLDALKSS